MNLTNNQMVLLLQIDRGSRANEIHPGTYNSDLQKLLALGLVRAQSTDYVTTKAGDERVQLALIDEAAKNAAASEAKPKKGKRKLAEAVLKSFVVGRAGCTKCQFCWQLQTDGERHTAECIVLYARSVVNKAEAK